MKHVRILSDNKELSIGSVIILEELTDVSETRVLEEGKLIEYNTLK